MGNPAKANELLETLRDALRDGTFDAAWKALDAQSKQWVYEYTANRVPRTQILVPEIVKQYLELTEPKVEDYEPR